MHWRTAAVLVAVFALGFGTALALPKSEAARPALAVPEVQDGVTGKDAQYISFYNDPERKERCFTAVIIRENKVWLVDNKWNSPGDVPAKFTLR